MHFAGKGGGGDKEFAAKTAESTLETEGAMESNLKKKRKKLAKKKTNQKKRRRVDKMDTEEGSNQSGNKCRL